MAKKSNEKRATSPTSLPGLAVCMCCGHFGGQQEFRTRKTDAGDCWVCADTQACQKRQYHRNA